MAARQALEIAMSRLALLVALAAAGAAMPAHAALTISAAIGGAPSGVTRENFDAPVTNGLGTATGVGVQWTGQAGQVSGAASGRYAAPWLSGDNGQGFGAGGTDQPAGRDASPYLYVFTGATLTLTLPIMAKYVGLLWGSIDGYNTLRLFNGETLVGTVGGADAAAAASTLPDGNQQGQGTAYVNIITTAVFNRLVFTSGSPSFEFDNLAFNALVPGGPDPAVVAGPAALALFLLGLAGLACTLRRTAD